MSRRVWVIAVAVVALAVVVAAGGLVWWFQRDEAPAAVDLASVVVQIEAVESADAASDPLTTAPSTAAPTTTTPPDDTGDNSGLTSGTGDEDSPGATTDENALPTGDGSITETAPADDPTNPLAHLVGVWTVQVAGSEVDLLDNPAVSFAGYRVKEVLAGGLGENTAVGRTADVAGSMELRDGVLVAVTVTVTMATLRTDDSHRDSHARGSLNTKEFPEASFTLVEPIELPAGMADGEAVSGPAVGALTIKGVTNRATFDLHAQLVDDTIVAVGSSPVVFGNYGVPTPSSIAVISVEDHGIMEFQLIFTR